MKRRNADSNKYRKQFHFRKYKFTEGMYGSTFLYLKFLLIWCLIMIADFLIEFRFEFLWPFWLFIRSIYDSYKYQGLIFSIFFALIAFLSDFFCYMFIPVQWLFFASSTYVWVQYVWHTEKGICLPTISLWLLFVYIEASVRLKSIKTIDLCRPFAAHCIGYPMVTLGFGFKSYLSYKLRLRKQRDVRKINNFYMKLLWQALPFELQHQYEQQLAATNNEKYKSISTALTKDKDEDEISTNSDNFVNNQNNTNSIIQNFKEKCLFLSNSNNTTAATATSLITTTNSKGSHHNGLTISYANDEDLPYIQQKHDTSSVGGGGGSGSNSNSSCSSSSSSTSNNNKYKNHQHNGNLATATAASLTTTTIGIAQIFTNSNGITCDIVQNDNAAPHTSNSQQQQQQQQQQKNFHKNSKSNSNSNFNSNINTTACASSTPTNASAASVSQSTFTQNTNPGSSSSSSSGNGTNSNASGNNKSTAVVSSINTNHTNININMTINTTAIATATAQNTTSNTGTTSNNNSTTVLSSQQTGKKGKNANKERNKANNLNANSVDSNSLNGGNNVTLSTSNNTSNGINSSVSGSTGGVGGGSNNGNLTSTIQTASTLTPSSSNSALAIQSGSNSSKTTKSQAVKDEYLLNFEDDVKKMKQELEQQKNIEEYLRSQINYLTKCDRSEKLKLEKLQQENEQLQIRLQKYNLQKQKDKDDLQAIEKRLQDEKRLRSNVENQLLQERKTRETQEKLMNANLQNTLKVSECSDFCKQKTKECEYENKMLKDQLIEKQDRLRMLECEIKSLLKYRDAQTSLVSALNIMEEKNLSLQDSLSAETRFKLDLFSALGETRRQLEAALIQLDSKEKELNTLRCLFKTAMNNEQNNYLQNDLLAQLTAINNHQIISNSCGNYNTSITSGVGNNSNNTPSPPPPPPPPSSVSPLTMNGCNSNNNVNSNSTTPINDTLLFN